jgi:peptide/nickel transport system permease protein
MFKKPSILGGLIIIGGIVFLALAAPLLASHDPFDQNLLFRLQPPSEEHIFGTDYLGRDVYSRILYGAKLSLIAGLIPVLIGMSLGTILGGFPIYVGGILDKITVRLIDFLFAFPTVLMAIIISALLGFNFLSSVVAVGLAMVPKFARVVRSAVASIKEENFIKASRLLGASHLRVFFTHILPNVATPIIIFSTIRIPMAIVAVSSLSFLGLGAKPPTPEWGLMVGEASRWILTAPTAILFPGILIIITALGFNIMGDALRDFLDPKTRY